MLNTNFVPDNYVQNKESRRANLFYIALFTIFLSVVIGSFGIVKMRCHSLAAKERLIDTRMRAAQLAMSKYEQLQLKHSFMMKTALTSVELLEPVPRSMLLASLTNNLPDGTSLLRLKIVQKLPVESAQKNDKTQYQQAVDRKLSTPAKPKVSPERLLETYIEIDGVAPSDLQVAEYIEKLSRTDELVDSVVLVESKEHKIEKTTFRQFKLTAMLKHDICITEKDINRIKTSSEKVARGK